MITPVSIKTDVSPPPASSTVAAIPPVQIPEALLKLYYRLMQLPPNTTILMQTDDKGVPVSITPLARCEYLTRGG